MVLVCKNLLQFHSAWILFIFWVNKLLLHLNTQPSVLCFDPFPVVTTSDIGTVKKHLKFGWDFDLTADFTLDNANTMKTQVRQKFKDWSLEVQRLGVSEPFCNTAECLDLNIKVSEYQNNFHLTFDIDVVP